VVVRRSGEEIEQQLIDALGRVTCSQWPAPSIRT